MPACLRREHVSTGSRLTQLKDALTYDGQRY
jgi:hypothetical protein